MDGVAPGARRMKVNPQRRQRMGVPSTPLGVAGGNWSDKEGVRCA